MEVDHERRPYKNHFNNKRRYRGREGNGVGNDEDGRLTRNAEDDEGDRRPTKQHRPRYEEPAASRLRRELMIIGEAVSAVQLVLVLEAKLTGQQPPHGPQDEAARIGRDIAKEFGDYQIQGAFLDNFVQL
jgi:hypothetical protein